MTPNDEYLLPSLPVLVKLETLLDRDHSSEEAIVTPDMDPIEAIMEAAPCPPEIIEKK